MGSKGLTSTPIARLLPFLAIYRHDLRTLTGNRLVRLWFTATVLLTFVIVASNWSATPATELIAMLMLPYLVFPWFLIVMILGIGPVSGSHAEGLADGILSRPVTRYEYLLAIWSSRVSVVLGVYLAVVVPAVCLIAAVERPNLEHAMTFASVASALGVAGLVLVFQVSLAFMLGTLLRKPFLCIVILLMFWYPINGLLHAFQLEEFSPLTLGQALPALLEGEDPADERAGDEAATGEDENAAEAEAQTTPRVGPFGEPIEEKPAPEEEKQTFFEGNDFKDISLLRILMGYGIPTLLCLGAAVCVFSLRDV